MKKFIEAAKAFRTCEQMQRLQAVGLFTKHDLREGLKRYIHLTYIEFK